MAERTNKRNLSYNNRHRTWGNQLTATDVDMLEYDCKTGKPVALVETKFGLGDVDLNTTQFDALCELARELPVICCVYFPMNKERKLVDAGHEKEMVHIQFYAFGVNEAGKRYLPKPKRLTEIEWVHMLRRLHGLPSEDPDCDWVYATEWWEVRLPQIFSRLKK